MSTSEGGGRVVVTAGSALGSGPHTTAPVPLQGLQERAGI